MHLTSSRPAFVLYDWAVTLSREVRLFWTGNARPLPAILYFSNKYLNMVPPIVALLGMTPIADAVRMQPPSYQKAKPVLSSPIDKWVRH